MEIHYVSLKAVYFICMEVVILPMLIGISVDIIALKLLKISVSGRYGSVKPYASQGLYHIFLHWLIGKNFQRFFILFDVYHLLNLYSRHNYYEIRHENEYQYNCEYLIIMITNKIMHSNCDIVINTYTTDKINKILTFPSFNTLTPLFINETFPFLLALSYFIFYVSP